MWLRLDAIREMVMNKLTHSLSLGTNGLMNADKFLSSLSKLVIILILIYGSDTFSNKTNHKILIFL